MKDKISFQLFALRAEAEGTNSIQIVARMCFGGMATLVIIAAIAAFSKWL